MRNISLSYGYTIFYGQICGAIFKNNYLTEIANLGYLTYIDKSNDIDLVFANVLMIDFLYWYHVKSK